jgi:ketosteroid isomerase-like protein
MRIEENKATIRKFLQCLDKSEFDAAFTLLTEDVQWWIPSDQPGGTVLSKAVMRGLVAKFIGIFTQAPAMSPGRITAEGDRVCLEQSSRGGVTHGGNSYGNDYHLLFELRDGLICEVREYMNPLMAAPLMAELEALRGGA